MTRTIEAANGILTLKVGDQVALKDGRVLKVAELNAGFGKIKLVDGQGGVVFSNPRDILRLVEEVIEAIEKTKDLWSWLKSSAVAQVATTIGKFIHGIFKKG